MDIELITTRRMQRKNSVGTVLDDLYLLLIIRDPFGPALHFGPQAKPRPRCGQLQMNDFMLPPAPSSSDAQSLHTVYSYTVIFS